MAYNPPPGPPPGQPPYPGQPFPGDPNQDPYQNGAYPGMPPQGWQYPGTPIRPTSGIAIAAMLLGIVSLLGGFVLFGVTAIAAVVCGHLGLRDTTSGYKDGRGMAIAGLILGYLSLLAALALILAWGSFHMQATS